MKRGSTKKPALSARKMQANRCNAQKSTGPRTAQGKARSSRNGITHGVFARDLVLAGEDAAELEALKHDVIRRLKPRDRLELKLVERVISNFWRMERVAAAEKELYETEPAELLKQARNDRERDKRFKQNQSLEDMQPRTNLQRLEEFRRSMPGAEGMLANKERLTSPELEVWWVHVLTMAQVDPEGIAGPLPRKPGEEQAHPPQRSAGRTLAVLINCKSPALERLHLYERRLEHSIQRCMNELRKLREMKSDDDDDELSPFAEALLNPATASALETSAASVPGSVGGHVDQPPAQPADAPMPHIHRETAKAKPMLPQESWKQEVVAGNVRGEMALSQVAPDGSSRSDCFMTPDRAEKCKIE